MHFDCAFADGVKLRIVRAFTTTDEVRKNHGIYADFSMKVIGQVSVKGGKPKEIELMSINGLTLSVSPEGKPFIGSIGKDDGRGGRIYANQFFPVGFDKYGSRQPDPDQVERQQDLIKRLSKVVTEAAEAFQRRAIEQRAQPIPTPAAFTTIPARQPVNKKQQDLPL